MKNRRNIFVIVVWMALIAIFEASLLAEATAKEVEDVVDASIQESPVQQPPKPKQHIDPFNIAIVGISLGCMMFAASVSRNRTQRRQLEAKIQELDAFLAGACAVDFHITGCKDTDPMMNSAQAIQNSRDIKLKEYEEHKNVMVRSISDIEAEIMRIWG